MTCKHEEAWLKVDECGYVAIVCKCSYPLAEFPERCKCEDKSPKNFLAFGEITETEARALELAIKESNK